MELVYIAIVISVVSSVMSIYALRRKIDIIVDDNDIGVIQRQITLLATQLHKLQNNKAENQILDSLEFSIKRLDKLEHTVENLIDVPVDPSEDEEVNPGGCTKTTHVWRKRPQLVNDHEHVYYCLRNCGSSLRHRFE